MWEHSEKCKRDCRIVIGAGRVVEAAWKKRGLFYTQMCYLPIQGSCADCMMRAITAFPKAQFDLAVDVVKVD